MRCWLLFLALGASLWAQSNGPGTGYTAYTGTNIFTPPTAPNMGAVLKNNTVYSANYGSGTPASVIRCTDQATDSQSPFNNQSKSAGQAGSGDAAQLFAPDDSLLLTSLSGGKIEIVPFNTTTLSCSPAITADKNLSNPGSSALAYNFGLGTFHWSSIPPIYYAMGAGVDAARSTWVVKYVFNSSNQFTVTAPYFDFIYGIPSGANQCPAWSQNTAYSAGDYVCHAFFAPDWAASTAYAAGTLIDPGTNNPLNCVFKNSTAGTSGLSGAEPIWSTIAQGQCVPASTTVINDNTAKWRNIGEPAANFAYQNVGSGGTSCAACTPSFSANFNSSATDGAMTWVNTGTASPPAWSDPSGISPDVARMSFGFSNNEYGNSGNYDAYNGDQGTGVYAVVYSSTLNEYVLLNTLTGWQSVNNCTPSCATAKLTGMGVNSVIATANCPYFIHNIKGSVHQDYITVAFQGLIPGHGTCLGTGTLWTPFIAFSGGGGANSTLQQYPYGLNHWAMQDHTNVSLTQQTGVNGGYSGGAYTILYPLTNVNTSSLLTSWQVGYAGATWVSTPQTTACDIDGTWFPGDTNPPCDFNKFDSHTGGQVTYDATYSDVTPVCGTMYNYQTLAPPPVAPWQGEEVCISTSPTWVNGAAIPAWRVWRFTPNFNTGGSSDFNTQFDISQLSGDGKYLAFSSDWMCTLGTTAGLSTGVLCGPPFVSGTVYTVGQFINPFSSNGGSGTNYNVWKVTSCGTGCVAATGPNPAWVVCNSGNVGTNITDLNGQTVYTCQGVSNGKGEMFVVQLALSLTSAPAAAIMAGGMISSTSQPVPTAGK